MPAMTTNDNDQQQKGRDQGPSDFVTGSVLFIIFLVFMTVWMMVYA